MSTTRLSDITFPGQFRCVTVDHESSAAILLKRLGVCEGRCVEVVQPGDPMVLRVVGARIGVSRSLAGSVLVEAGGEPVGSVAVAMAVRKDDTLSSVVASRHTAAEVVSHA